MNKLTKIFKIFESLAASVPIIIQIIPQIHAHFHNF